MQAYNNSSTYIAYYYVKTRTYMSYLVCNILIFKNAKDSTGDGFANFRWK